MRYSPDLLLGGRHAKPQGLSPARLDIGLESGRHSVVPNTERRTLRPRDVYPGVIHGKPLSDSRGDALIAAQYVEGHTKLRGPFRCRNEEVRAWATLNVGKAA